MKNSQEKQAGVEFAGGSIIELVRGGISIIPTQGDKSPHFSALPRIEGKPTWSPFQTRLATEAEVQNWVEMGVRSWGVVGGRVSGQLVQLDFEGKDHADQPMTPVFEDWKNLAKTALRDAGLNQGQPLSICQTPSGGFHVRWRVDTQDPLPCEPDVAEKFARDKDGEILTDPRQKPIRDKLIETKNEGGYCLCPPSEGYREVSGSLSEIPTVSMEVHQLLMDIARSFHTAVEAEAEDERDRTKDNSGDRKNEGLRPGDDFDQRGDHHALLQKHGWTLSFERGDIEYWKHAQTQKSVSANWNYIPNRFYVFSTSTDLDHRHAYSKFALYAQLEHDGDFSRAAKELGQLGFGQQDRPPSGARQERTDDNMGADETTYHLLRRSTEHIILTQDPLPLELAQKYGYPKTHIIEGKQVLLETCEDVDTVFVVENADLTDLLFAEGFDVRIIETPASFVEFLAEGGDLNAVLDAAASFLQKKVDEIAAMNGRKRTRAVNALLAILKEFEPLDRDAALVVMVEAKIGGLTTLRQQMKSISTAHEKSIPDDDQRYHRKVTEQSDHYTAFNPETQGVDVISNFIIVPTLRVFLNDRESIIADFVSADRTITGIVIERTDWNDKQRFMNVIPSVDFWFDGTLSQIQSVLAIVATYDVPTKTGVDKVGLHAPTQTWVMPSGGFTKTGYHSEIDLAYTPPGGISEWESILINPADETPDFEMIKPQIAELLPKINQPEIIWGAIGWFCATPYKQAIFERLGGFPFLNMIGTPGTGKSSTLKIFARLFGYTQHGRLFSSDQTAFVLLRLLSSTETVPVVFDEYKSDMGQKKREMLIRFIRRTYNGESEMRGNPDKTLTRFVLTAPVVLGGEIDIDQPAMTERMICLLMNPKGLTIESRKAYQALHDLPLEAFFKAYTLFALRSDFNAEWQKIGALFEDVIPESPDRIAKNFKTMVFGMTRFAKFMGIKIEDGIINSTIAHVTRALSNDGFEDEPSGNMKGGFDQFVEHLATMAETGRLTEGVHYERHENELRIRFSSCFAEFLKFVRETNLPDEVLTKNAYRRQARENALEYVLHTTKTYGWRDGENRRSLSIDLSIAENKGLDLVGFSTKQIEIDTIV